MIFLWSEGCSCVFFELQSPSQPVTEPDAFLIVCMFSFLPSQRLGPTCLIDWNFCCVQWVCAADTSLLVLRRDFPFTDQGTVKIKSRLNFRTGNRSGERSFPLLQSTIYSLSFLRAFMSKCIGNVALLWNREVKLQWIMGKIPPFWLTQVLEGTVCRRPFLT